LYFWREKILRRVDKPLFLSPQNVVIWNLKGYSNARYTTACSSGSRRVTVKPHFSSKAADFTGLSKSKVGRYYKDLSQNVPVSQGISFGTGVEPDWIFSFSPQDRTNILSLVDELELSISSASG
jgi:hypothetical protein